jgi:primosomal protein N' (replication factor Y)
MKRQDREGNAKAEPLLFEDSGARRLVRVVPEVVLDRCFDYLLPEHLELPRLGQRVKVPWNKKTVLAYVVGFPETGEVERCRPVESVLDEDPVLPEEMIGLAEWMAEYYCTDFALVLKGMLPEPVRSRESGYLEQLRVFPNHEMGEIDIQLRLKNAKAQQRAWAALHDVDSEGEWLSVLIKETRTSQKTWREMEKKGLICLAPARRERNPLGQAVEADVIPELTGEQKKALEAIRQCWTNSPRQPVILQGVTGSGKTEIYLRLIESELQAGRSALVLVPEIALTPQTVERFRARFERRGIQLAVLHSKLSAGERHDQWQLIRKGEARVVIGPRSALFAPLHHLGLIVIDEEHEGSYKQEEAPRYHARDVAILRGHRQGARVLLGSATPSMESLHNARIHKFCRVLLEGRVDDAVLPVIHLVDMRKAAQPEGGHGLISATLADAVRDRLEKKEQVILFLNRRGYSTSLQCPNCGHVFECSHCSVPMTFHRQQMRLVCHLCDEEGDVPEQCPNCGFDKIKYQGTGTQRIEESVETLFPEATWQRMDSDSMASKHATRDALAAFKAGDIDILIGTQMIAKGLHFPRVTCVGVINVDSALQMPDFRAAERVFSQLVQVAGRAGRGQIRGEVFIQTRTPFHPVIQFARHHDVLGFSDQELEFRQEHAFPPFRRAVLVTISGRDEEKTNFCAGQVVRKLKHSLGDEVEVPDAVPAPIAKLRDRFRFHVFLLTGQILKMSPVLRKELIDVEWPEGIRVTVDVDPYSLL